MHKLFLAFGFAMIGYGVIGDRVNNQAIADNTTIPQQPVEPSLWWKLDRLAISWVDDVTIDAKTRQAIITINSSRWRSLDYVQRFSFLFKVGVEAQKQNFNLLLLDRRLQKVAEYSYSQDFWQMTPETLGADPFRVIAPTILQQKF
jgi:hypothetical protein